MRVGGWLECSTWPSVSFILAIRDGDRLRRHKASPCLHQKPEEAEPFFERARQADPLASFPYMLTALGLLTARRPQETHRYAEQALTFEKEDASALFCSSLANVALGRFEEGIAAAEHGVAASHRGADFLGLLGWALATAGRNDEAETLLEELRARPAAAPPIVSEGWLLGALGEIDAAFEVLARAEDAYQLWLYYTGLPAFDTLRADPRWPADPYEPRRAKLSCSQVPFRMELLPTARGGVCESPL